MDRKAAWRLALVIGISLAVGSTAGITAHAQENLHSAMVYYTGPSGPGHEVNAVVAQRYEAGITGLEISQNATEVKNLNPDFSWYVYNSSTDNYQDSEENAMLATIAAQHGADPETCFLHYYDDTRLMLQGTTVVVRGWGGGTATTMAEARVPVYYSDLSRRVTNFGTPMARQIHKEVMLALSVDRTFTGTALHPDGIFLDNQAHTLYNYGEVQQGGHVFEAPGHAFIDGAAFQTWWWNDAVGPFLTALKDTLETSATWSVDHHRKYLMINIANDWTDSFASRDVADVLFMEFQYDPVRNSDTYAVQQAWQHDRLAANAGIRSFYAPCMKTTAPPYPGEITYGEALLGSLAWNLATRTEESMLYLFGTCNPGQAGWDTLTWRGCVDVVKDQLGEYSGDPFIYTQGTDPTGKAYTVWARNYDNGLVLVRNRGQWNEGIEPETAVPVHMANPLSPVAPSGVILPATTTISMRNGTGAILIGTPGPPPGNPPVANFSGTPRSGHAPLGVTFTDLSTNSPTSWSWTFGDGGTSTARNPSHTYAAVGTYTVSLTATNAYGSDGETKVGYIIVTSAPAPPVANFSGTPRSGHAPLGVTFTDLSTNSPTSWSWTFGDGGTSTARNPTHTYAAVGTYTVSLTATNAYGSDGETKVGYITVTSAPAPPVANFSGTPRSGHAPLGVTFTDLSTNSPTSWSWTFGDGGTSTARNPSHTYAAVGTYTVSLTATNAGGSDTETKVGYVTVTGGMLAPVANFVGSPFRGSAPLTIKLTDLSTGNPQSWSWTFGDGGTSTTRNPEHTYTAPGAYTVSLTASNSGGSDTETKVGYVTVMEDTPQMVPVAIFEGSPLSGSIPLSVNFVDGSLNDPTSWSWDFGDGGTSNVEHPTHSYTNPGTYTVSLLARGGGGAAVAIRTDYITVAAAPVPLQSPASALKLDQPSPVNRSGEITYSIPTEGDVRLELFDLDGRCLAVLDEGHRGAGEHRAPFHLVSYGTGAHFLRLIWEDQVLTRRVILIK